MCWISIELTSTKAGELLLFQKIINALVYCL